MITEVNDSNYETIVTNSNKPTIMKFSAPWCKQCVPMTVVLNEISDEYVNDINVVEIDVDDNPVLTKKFQIKNLPTILFMKNDKIIEKQVGATTKIKIVEKMNKLTN